VSAEAWEAAGCFVACATAAAAVLARDPRLRYAAVGASLLLALVLIAGQVWEEPRFEELRSNPAAIGLALVLGGVALGATAATFVRVPAALALAAFVVLSLRIPIRVGDETNFLLVPLYGVIAAGWLRAAWLLVRGRGEELVQVGSPKAGEPALARWLCLALAASLVVYGLGVAWTNDAENAVRNVAFFLAPFAALFVLLRDLRWHRALLRWLALAVGATAAAFALIALWQYWQRELTLNEELQAANQLHLYFRANSLFRDPNVLGRYLALAILVTAAWLAWNRSGRLAAAGVALAALLLCGLAVTFSQTSFLSLVAGLAVLLWLRSGLRGAATAVALGAAAIAVFLALGGMPQSDFERQRNDLAEVSSGRADLVSGGIELFERRPLLGWGSGSFSISFRREIERVPRPVSHNEPITVAAEQGLLGLIPYAAVVLLGLAVLLRPGRQPAARGALVACFVALLVHSLGYAAFAIDPATWAVLALGLALRE
jgi:O-antigen ligase